MLRAALVKRHFNATYAIERHQLGGTVRRAIAKATATLEERRGVLEVVGPEAVLSRGYSVTTDARGRLVRDCDAVARGDELLTRLVDGSIRSTVTGSEAD
jgi:exodeoxyribonuclease VII large subunit